MSFLRLFHANMWECNACLVCASILSQKTLQTPKQSRRRHCNGVVISTPHTRGEPELLGTQQKTPSGVRRGFGDRIEAQTRQALHSHILTWNKTHEDQQWQLSSEASYSRIPQLKLGRAKSWQPHNERRRRCVLLYSKCTGEC